MANAIEGIGDREQASRLNASSPGQWQGVAEGGGNAVQRAPQMEKLLAALDKAAQSLRQILDELWADKQQDPIQSPASAGDCQSGGSGGAHPAAGSGKGAGGGKQAAGDLGKGSAANNGAIGGGPDPQATGDGAVDLGGGNKVQVQGEGAAQLAHNIEGWAKAHPKIKEDLVRSAEANGGTLNVTVKDLEGNIAGRAPGGGEHGQGGGKGSIEIDVAQKNNQFAFTHELEHLFGYDHNNPSQEVEMRARVEDMVEGSEGSTQNVPVA